MGIEAQKLGNTEQKMRLYRIEMRKIIHSERWKKGMRDDEDEGGTWVGS